MRFRRLSLDKLESVLAIEEEAYEDPWTHGMFRQELANGASHFYLAYLGESLVGYAGFWLVLDDAHITKVTIAAPYRGLGLGELLLKRLLEKAADLGAVSVRLEVRENNIRARTLYDKMGFQEVRVRKGYYTKTNESAVEMALSLA